MTFDTTAFVRLDALQMFDKSASGASFTTSTGDILEVSCYGPGVFRMRVGPSTQPDYGLVVGRTKACTVEHGENGAWKFTCGRIDAGNLVRAAALSPAASRRAGRGIDHGRAFPGLHEASRVRPRAPGRALDRGALARLGRARVWPRREIRPAQQARTAHPLACRRCARRQHRPRLQECAVRVEPRHRQGRVGSVRPHDGVGHAWRRASRLVAPLVRDRPRGRGARSLRLRRGHARRHSRPVHAAHGPRRHGPAVEPRALGLARVLQDAGGSGGRRGEAARAQDSLRCADARRPRGVEGRNARRFRMGSRPLSESSRRARRDPGAQPADMRVGVSRTCRCTRRCSWIWPRAATS